MSPATLRVVLAPRAALDVGRLLREAALLARALDADLAALFVEEAELLRCVALPFSVEVGLVSGAVRPTDAEATRRLLARRAEQVRDLLARAASTQGVAWSFAVARGDVAREALTAAAATPVLLAPPRTPVQRAVGDPPGGPGAGPVALFAESGPTGPSVPTGPTGPTARAWATATRLAEGRPVTVRLRLADLARGEIPRVLVVPLSSLRSSGELERLLAAARCPVVLVG